MTRSRGRIECDDDDEKNSVSTTFNVGSLNRISMHDLSVPTLHVHSGKFQPYNLH